MAVESATYAQEARPSKAAAAGSAAGRLQRIGFKGPTGMRLPRLGAAAGYSTEEVGPQSSPLPQSCRPVAFFSQAPAAKAVQVPPWLRRR